MPKQVRVGAFTFAVDLAPIPTEHQPAWGVTTPHLERIVLEPSQRGNFLRDTFLHEVIHACLFVSGVNVAELDEERLVAALSPVLLAALRDNPAMLTYLLATDGD